MVSTMMDNISYANHAIHHVVFALVLQMPNAANARILLIICQIKQHATYLVLTIILKI